MSGYKPNDKAETAETLADGWDRRTSREALDEVAREIQVRERCFPRWITEGRVSNSDAKDRLQRLIKAANILASAIDAEAGIPENAPA